MPNKSLLAVLFTIVINMMGVGLMWPILPVLVQELYGGTISQSALVYGGVAVIFSVMQLLFAPLMGALSDRYGRRRIMLLALCGLGLDTLLLAFAPSIFWVFAGRALGGIFGATFSIANAYVADTTPSDKRAGAFGLIGAAFGIGFIIGPLIGGVLGDINLRYPFYLAAFLSFANLVFGYFFLQESLPPEKRSSGSLLKANPFGAIRFIGSNPVLLLLGIALLLVNTSQRGMEAVWVLFTQFQYNWNQMEVGASLAIVGISYVIVQGFLVRIVVSALGEMRTIVCGFLLSSIMYVILSFNTIPLFGYIGIIPYVVGWGCAAPAIQAIASRQVLENQQGLLQGALTSIGGLAAIAGPALSTTSFSYFTSKFAPVTFPGAYFVFGAITLVIAAWLGVSAGRAASNSK
ncbi:MAG: MFS transporter [Pseudomonadota bacterium]